MINREASPIPATYPPKSIHHPTKCKRRYTALFATLCSIVLAVAACGGKTDNSKPYVVSVSAQESCCAGLGDPGAKQSCLDKIVRVDDPAVQASDANRATYACVERHFECNRSTGTATAPSAQAQLDCINDIQ